MQEHPVVIIGAGLTGLSCAHHLGGNYLLVEKELEPGGIVRTRIRQNSFYCDGTGHWLHLRNAAMKDLVNKLLAGNLVEHERKAVIFSHGVFTAYPFQANTYGLPREVIMECLLGLLKAKHPEDFGQKPIAEPPNNFHEWIVRAFGEGIARHFMVPYNQKLLGVKLTELMPAFAERFIPRPSTEDVIKGALGFSKESLGYNAKFVYPKEGGIGALSRAFANSLKEPPLYGVHVTSVDLKQKTVSLSNGKTMRFGRLVNTMPLVQLISLLKDAPDEVRVAAKNLRATTVYYYDIGVRGKGGPASHYHWVYFPEPEFIFYRAGSYSAVHKEAAPPGCRSYYVEMSGDLEGLRLQPEKLKQRVLIDLKKAGVLAVDDEILFAELCEIPHAYVIFDQHYEESRGLLFDYLKNNNVLTGGRWGGWGYGGMEDAMLDGKAAAEQIHNA
ncbi:MAG TPA: FAD-dependent oxidoreductase [Verrucomicrobiae bacterium]|nr:FAD-dependent oxidoreductase [Verrucomicrobiae bacterium]